jgi:uncharacterized protein YcfJ
MGRKILLMVLAGLLIAGCESMGPKAKTGAVTGGVVGAVAGGVIGHQMGSGIEGAAIGAAVGAIAGGLIGNEIDKADRKALEANPNYLAITSIIDMAAKGMPDDGIIDEIKRTKSTYNLTTEMVDYLRKNKVSDRVINYMLSTGTAGRAE